MLQGLRIDAWLLTADSMWPSSTAGFQVNVVSTKGGQVPIDPKSIQEPQLTSTTARFLKDSEALFPAQVHCSAYFSQHLLPFRSWMPKRVL